MEFALFYGLNVLWNASAFAKAILILGSMIGAISVLWIGADGDEADWRPVAKIAETVKWPVIGLVLLVVMTPSKNDLYFIAGGGLTLMAAQNKEVQKLPDNAVKAVNSFLERLAEEKQQ